MKTYKFNVQVTGEVIFSDGPKPIFDEYDKLIGAFNVLSGNVVQCFIAGSGYPAVLAVTVGEPFYFTPVESAEGEIVAATLSEIPKTHRSSIVPRALISTEDASAETQDG